MNLKLTGILFIAFALLIVLPSCEKTTAQKGRDSEAAILDAFFKAHPNQYVLTETGLHEKMPYYNEGIKEKFDNLNGTKDDDDNIIQDSTVVRTGDKVQIVYRVYFLDDDENPIDGTRSDFEPLEFVVGVDSNIRTAWHYAISGKNVNTKFDFVTPSRYAYGATGTSGIPAYTPLRFEIEIKKLYRLKNNGEYIHLPLITEE